MKKAGNITIAPANIASVQFNNSFKIGANESAKFTIRNGMRISVSPSSPNLAMVYIKFEAVSDDEECSIAFKVETVTAVSSSTYIDDLEDVIKRDYSGIIMYGANEKIHSVATSVGINFALPTITIREYDDIDSNDDGNNDDDIIDFTKKKK